MFDNIILEPEQITLLCSLVESVRSIPRDERTPFFGSHPAGGPKSRIMHPGLPGQNAKVYMGDIEALAHAGLLYLRLEGTRGFDFDIAPAGFRFYEVTQTKISAPVERIQMPLKNYLEGDRLRTTYPSAFEKWSKAESKLWESDSAAELSTIGHLCREAMQEFSTTLVNKYQPPNIDNDKSHSIARLKAALTLLDSNIPTTLTPFLNSILSYWGTLSDLVQRQEHSGQREAKPLTWEDGKRVVFHTAVVFSEFDRIISATA